MKSLNKKVALFLYAILCTALIFPSQRPPADCWRRFTSCLLGSKYSEVKMAEEALRVTSLYKPIELKDIVVTNKDFVRPYQSEDFNAVRENLIQNHFFMLPLKITEGEALVYEEHAVIKGVCLFSPHIAHITELSVGKPYQGKGVGKALMCATMHMLKKDHNITTVELHTVPSAKLFYEKLGFRFEGIKGKIVFK